MNIKLKAPALLTLAAAAAPTAAWASMYGDFGPFALLAVPLTLLREAGPVALMVAAWLFWKKQRSGWLLACVLGPMSMSLAARLSYQVLSAVGFSASWPMLTVFPFIHMVIDWSLLAVAISQKPQGADAAPAQQAQV